MLHAQGPIFSSHTWVVYSRGGGGVFKEGSVRIFRVKEVDHTFQPSRAKLRAKLGVEA